MELQVGVKILLKNAEGKYLLIRRSITKENSRGKWDIPGGRINAGSPLLENLAREIKEETGFVLDNNPVFLTVQEMIRPERHVVRLLYTGRAEGDPTLSWEHSEYKWMTVEEVKSLTETEFDRYLVPLFLDGTLS